MGQARGLRASKRCQLFVFTNWASLYCQPSGVPRGTVSRPVIPPTSVEMLGAMSSRALSFLETTDDLCLGQCHSHSQPAHGTGHLCSGHQVPGTARVAPPSCRRLSGLWWWPLFYSGLHCSHRVILGRGMWSLWVGYPQLYKGKDYVNTCP